MKVFSPPPGGQIAQVDALSLEVAGLATFLGTWPTGDTAIVIVNEGGYAVGKIAGGGLSDPTTTQLRADMDTVVDLPDGYAMWPSGGVALIVNEAGYGVRLLDDGASSSSSSEDATADHVAAVLMNGVENQPLLVGANVLFAWGESKADNINQQETAFDAIVLDQSASLPGGATVVAGVDAHPGHKISELLDPTELASLRAAIDARFTAGAECISTVALICQCNDMIAGTAPDTWERTVLEAVDLIQHYSMQKYVGSNPADPMPIPPVGVVVDGTYGKVGGRNIALRSIEMARRIYRFGVIVPDYICAMAANQGDISPDDTGVHWTQADIRLMCDYIALFSYYWRVLKKKYEPTQVIDGWTQGNDFYLRCTMPHPPLVADTALVSSIADNGLTGLTAAAASVTLSSLSIVGGGTIIKGTASASLAGSGRIRGAWAPTTAGRSGKVNGARTMYRDSSPYVGSTAGPLYSPLMPFEFIFS